MNHSDRAFREQKLHQTLSRARTHTRTYSHEEGHTDFSGLRSAPPREGGWCLS